MKRATVIRKMMNEKNMKVADIAKATELPYSTIKSILENGVTKAGYVNVWLICRALGITTDDLEVLAKDIDLEESTIENKTENNENGFLQRFEVLMRKCGIKNIHELSAESGIPYTTLKGFYVRGTDNIQMSTLLKLKAFFDCSLDYLVDGDTRTQVENSITLEEDEVDVLRNYNQLKSEKKTFLSGYIKALIDTQE